MKKFSFKKFISILLFFAFFTAGLSGIILCIMPHGRIAYWLNWSLMGLNKGGWESVHLSFAVLILIAGILHLLVFNWKLFLSYFKAPGFRGGLSKEFYGAVVMFIMLFISSVNGLPPASTLMAKVDHFKEGWVAEDLKPPFPHAELMSVEELSRREGIPVELAVKRLAEHGFKIKKQSQSIAFVARDNNVSARELYLYMKGEK